MKQITIIFLALMFFTSCHEAKQIKSKEVEYERVGNNFSIFYLKIKGMDYAISSSGNSFRNLTLDSLQFEYYKNLK